MVDRIVGGAAVPPVSRHDETARVHDAAQQFESLLLGQILKSMRETEGGGWMGSGDDQAGATAIAMAEEQFAQALAQGGGLGLANMVVSGLQRK
jgi:flagellar protein FlgJ